MTECDHLCPNQAICTVAIHDRNIKLFLCIHHQSKFRGDHLNGIEIFNDVNPDALSGYIHPDDDIL